MPINGMGKPRKIRAKNSRTPIKGLDDFIVAARLVHGVKYDYSKAVYVKSNLPIAITCYVHGDFFQRPVNHLAGSGCPLCSLIEKETHKLTKEEFIVKANNVHGGIYNYSLVEYKSNRTKVRIICPKHGIFEQTPYKHTGMRQGCPRCGNEPIWERKRLSTEKFVIKAKLRHGDRYDYSSTIYKDCNTKVEILCPKHGVFLQRPTLHFMGKGCPRCRDSRGEREIKEILDKKGIKYFQQYKFEKCKDKRMLPFDFYIPSMNIAIEFQGIQHYRSVSIWDGDEGLKTVQFHDDIKAKFCLDNHIYLRYISHNDDIEKRLEFILKTRYRTRPVVR
jgi:hypothetical protein